MSWTNLQELITQGPHVQQANYSDWNTGGKRIEIAPNPDGSAIDIGTLTIPATESVHITSPCPTGARVTGTILIKGSSYRSVVIENLFIEGGGIEIEGGTRRFTEIRNCVFNDITSDYAIRTSGQTVVNLGIYRCMFNRCKGGISLSPENTDMVVIDHCSFNRNTGIDILIGTSGTTVRDCWFETRDTNFTNPHINITFGLCTITRCRFHPDVDGTQYGPPKYPIVIGTVGGQDSGTIGGVHITDNNFYGMNPYGPTSTAYPDDSQAKACVHLSKGLYQSVIDRNYWRKHATAFVHVDYASASSRDNYFGFQMKDSNYNASPNFSAAATGWVKPTTEAA